MTTVHANSGLKLYMQSAIAAGTAITAATLADPGVFTSATHGYSNGDVILIECDGMHEVNSRLFKVVSVATDTFQLCDMDGATGIDTTDFSAFLSGTAKKITLGTSIVGVAECNPSGGEIKVADSTTVHDHQDTQIIVGASAFGYDMLIQWDPANAAQQAMRRAYEIRAAKGFKVLWPDGAFILFYGAVGYTMSPGGGKQGVTTAPAKIVLQAALTNYAA